uniref:Secreted protein n=1 Tax=Angiostrongylus cantonensis TaxID=6313 RepID=A0A0K0D8F6_ANGCA
MALSCTARALKFSLFVFNLVFLVISCKHRGSWSAMHYLTAVVFQQSFLISLVSFLFRCIVHQFLVLSIILSIY